MQFYGVCEGFYGKPWVSHQRKSLFERMSTFGLNTYLYAPKDDFKHRIHWRDLYTVEETDELFQIIKYSKDNHIKFVYAISPGIDIEYSKNSEIEVLKQKLQQVANVGCTGFAILFDDIDTKMTPDDEKNFGTFAKAQCHVANTIFSGILNCDLFMFCPTEYCNTRADPDVKRSEYLNTLGDCLNKVIQVLWTGKNVVSKFISVSDILEVERVIKRKPLIWDNCHANDYDQTRIYLGPYSGRDDKIKDHISGVLTNPNCEFESNFNAIHTLSQWIGCLKTVSTEYTPVTALKNSIKDWLPYLMTAVSVEGSTTPKSVIPDQHNSKISKQNIKKVKKSVTDDVLDENDLILLAELFHLPDQYGTAGSKLLQEATWLLQNVHFLTNSNKNTLENSTSKQSTSKKKSYGDSSDEETSYKKQQQNDSLSFEEREWYRHAISFHDGYDNICKMIDRLMKIPNRAFFYEIYSYISDMRSTVSMLNSYVTWHGMGKRGREPFTKSKEPWIHYGGLHAELRRLIPIEEKNYLKQMSLSRVGQSSKCFTVRPYIESDKIQLFSMCTTTSCNNFPNFPNLIADYVVGVHLALEPNLCFVLEDEKVICGFALATCHIKNFMLRAEKEYVPDLKKKYSLKNFPPNVITEDEHKIIHDLGKKPIFDQNLIDAYPGFVHFMAASESIVASERIGSEKLLRTIINYMKNLHVKGIHCRIDKNQKIVKELYEKLGFIIYGRKNDDSPSYILVYDF